MSSHSNVGLGWLLGVAEVIVSGFAPAETWSTCILRVGLNESEQLRKVSAKNLPKNHDDS